MARRVPVLLWTIFMKGVMAVHPLTLRTRATLAGLALIALLPSPAAVARTKAAAKVEVNLKKYSVSRENYPDVLFSKNGQSVCVCWELGDVNPDYPIKLLGFVPNGEGG